MARPDTPAGEVKRLARIAVLARVARRHERALERAMLAAIGRGIGVRKIAAAAGVSHSTVWRLARPGSGHSDEIAKDTTRSNPVGKPERGEK